MTSSQKGRGTSIPHPLVPFWEKGVGMRANYRKNVPTIDLRFKVKMQLILYSKPGCHLCEGLQEKLEQVAGLELEVRNIIQRDDWFRAYEYEVPVLFVVHSSPSGQREVPLPRPSPRSTIAQLTQLLQPYNDC